MSKKKGKTPRPAAKTMTARAPKMEAFTFGEPVPVLDRRDILVQLYLVNFCHHFHSITVENPGHSSATGYVNFFPS